MAFVGGYLDLPSHLFKLLVGIVLLLSAIRFLMRPTPDTVTGTATKPIAVSLGAGLGLLSGLTGTGGGIFLTPLLLFMGWARQPSSAGRPGRISAADVSIKR
jgi:uncharacterized membrane protein YfcA